MRVLLFATIVLTVSSCRPPPPPANGPRAMIQRVDGHTAAIIVSGDTVLVIPLDTIPAGTMILSKGKVAPLESPQMIPGQMLGCPCCYKGCPRCLPAAGGLGCHLFPELPDWPGLDHTLTRPPAGGPCPPGEPCPDRDPVRTPPVVP